ncbi:UDP-N-acetyl-D-mannosaminuronic acid dehydrogenase [Sphingomonas sp. Leaf16]|nr:UDP-N-acetyl-D-mannosaminuronic acid dehydrogenase [Sphingomonas sp. Leaf16]KQN13819.1 UDP-N-acetyl-D-mannosaminuronic acid dehydrogenase [Sphingomonas sp. Leaf29]KQN21401.1 UDP-N-acetyl-D-mannosaminuronic acid dehydrogenase [Sphingomonas sp. Leaf32]
MAAADTYDVCVVGLGYIGLPTAAVVARSGARVIGIDVSQHVVDTVARGDIHIEEADLDTLVRDVVLLGRLTTATTPAPSNIFVIAVPTPFGPGHVPDLSYVLNATRAIAPVLAKGNTVILESTSPVGTTEQIRDLLAELRPDLALPGVSDTPDIAVAYCPERVLPGRIILELVSNERSIGGITPACAEAACGFYRRFVEGACTVTTARTAEMVKLVENTSRDVAIAFANELSIVCDKMDLNVWDVIELANRHPRVNILKPGPGVGGHCIAVDPWFIVDAAPEQTPLIRTAREVNDGKVDHVVTRAAAMLDASPDARASLLGLAFKADIDDLRESPAVKVAQALIARYGDRIDLVEPFVTALPRSLDGGRLVSLDEGLSNDILVVLVDHSVFKTVPVEARADKQLYDTRGMWR